MVDGLILSLQVGLYIMCVWFLCRHYDVVVIIEANGGEADSIFVESQSVTVNSDRFGWWRGCSATWLWWQYVNVKYCRPSCKQCIQSKVSGCPAASSNVTDCRISDELRFDGHDHLVLPTDSRQQIQCAGHGCTADVCTWCSKCDVELLCVVLCTAGFHTVEKFNVEQWKVYYLNLPVVILCSV